MAFNPMNLMQIGNRLQIFKTQHPRVPAFCEKVGKEAIKEGSIIEIKVTSPEGKEYVTNLRLTADDMQTLDLITGKTE